jgi:hypothetical protein
VKLGAVEVVEHAWSADEDDTAGGLAGLVGERSGEEGLSGAGHTNEERVDALGKESEVVESEVARADLLPRGVEVEVESVDGVDLREAGVAEATLDGAAETALLLLVAEAVDHVEGGEVVPGGEIEQCRYLLCHPGQPEPAQLLNEQVAEVVVVLHAEDSPGGSSGGGVPGSRVIATGGSWS